MKRKKRILLSMLALLLVLMAACSSGGLEKPIPVDENSYPSVSEDVNISGGENEVEMK